MNISIQLADFPGSLDLSGYPGNPHIMELVFGGRDPMPQFELLDYYDKAGAPIPSIQQPVIQRDEAARRITIIRNHTEAPPLTRYTKWRLNNLIELTGTMTFKYESSPSDGLAPLAVMMNRTPVMMYLIHDASSVITPTGLILKLTYLQASQYATTLPVLVWVADDERIKPRQSNTLYLKTSTSATALSMESVVMTQSADGPVGDTSLIIPGLINIAPDLNSLIAFTPTQATLATVVDGDAPYMLYAITSQSIDLLSGIDVEPVPISGASGNTNSVTPGFIASAPKFNDLIAFYNTLTTETFPQLIRVVSDLSSGDEQKDALYFAAPGVLRLLDQQPV